MGSGMTIDYRTDYRAQHDRRAEIDEYCNIIHTLKLF